LIRKNTKILNSVEKNYYRKIAIDMLEHKYTWEGDVLKIHYSDSEPDICGVERKVFYEYLKETLFAETTKTKK